MTLKLRSRGDLSLYCDYATGLELEGSFLIPEMGKILSHLRSL